MATGAWVGFEDESFFAPMKLCEEAQARPCRLIGPNRARRLCDLGALVIDSIF